MIIVFVLMLLAIVWIFWSFKKMTVEEAEHTDFPAEWESYLSNNLEVYSKFSEELKKSLKVHILMFLDRVDFEGVREQKITDELRVTIAGQACLLIVKQRQYVYQVLKKVVVYPRAYRIEGQEEAMILGQSSADGVVYLSWDDSQRGAWNWHDGKNVVIHEFAHQLDQEDGSADGVPLLSLTRSCTTFAGVIADEYLDICERSGKRRRHVIDDYAQTNQAEFFAVATESFFEKPRQMQKKHPELFGALLKYYKLDPLKWC